MENASKALIMAGGILIGVLMLTLMVTSFMNSRELFSTYDEKRKLEEIQKFNVNFTKYIGQDLNLYQIVTICNFAELNNVVMSSGKKTIEDIKKIYTEEEYEEETYRINVSYSEDGYINAISIY